MRNQRSTGRYQATGRASTRACGDALLLGPPVFWMRVFWPPPVSYDVRCADHASPEPGNPHQVNPAPASRARGYLASRAMMDSAPC